VISALCFIIGSYRVWAKEYAEVLRLHAESEKENNQIIREFEEIKANMLLTTFVSEIDTELDKLKLFLHKHSFLLSRSDVGKFYKTYIASKEIHLKFGASLDFTAVEYKQMQEQLAQIDLQSEPTLESES
jgi:hypothetical protein